jgi:molecular chaperone IbpA
MTRLTSLDLTPFYRSAVGFDQLFDRITSNIDTATTNGSLANYPPYDILRTGEETYRIRLAVAGFQMADIKIELTEGVLSVSGSSASDEDAEYLHKGISNRSFTRTFNLADYVEVKGATLKDGILKIDLERYVPEVMKPKIIEITSEK